MPDISIIIPLDGTRAQFHALATSLGNIEDEIAQIVVVRPSGTEVEPGDLDELPGHPIVVDSDGGLGDLWNAGIEASSAAYVYPASCRIRFAKAFYHVCDAQVARAPVDLLFFHMQEYDLASQAYTSKRWSMRLGLPAKPFQPSQHADHIIQRLSANACSAVYSRRFLEEQGFRFSAVASFDDDPGLPTLITSADTISNLPWPLAVLAYDPTSMFDEVEHDAFMRRYETFSRLYGDGLPLGVASSSLLEWAVRFAPLNIEHAPDELAEWMLDSMGQHILPVVGERLEARSDASRLEGAETLLLSPMSRRDLVGLISELRTDGGEERYRSEMLEIMLNRAQAGSQGTTRPRRRGLFRR